MDKSHMRHLARAHAAEEAKKVARMKGEAWMKDKTWTNDEASVKDEAASAASVMSVMNVVKNNEALPKPEAKTEKGSRRSQKRTRDSSEPMVKTKAEHLVAKTTASEEQSLLPASTAAVEAYAKAHIEACMTGKAVMLQMLFALREDKYSHAHLTAQFTPEVQTMWMNATNVVCDAAGLQQQLNTLMCYIDLNMMNEELTAMKPVELCEQVSGAQADKMQEIVEHVSMWHVCQAIDNAKARLDFWEVMKCLED